METRTAGVTVKAAEPDFPLTDAVIVVVPEFTPAVATPVGFI